MVQTSLRSSGERRPVEGVAVEAHRAAGLQLIRDRGGEGALAAAGGASDREDLFGVDLEGDASEAGRGYVEVSDFEQGWAAGGRGGAPCAGGHRDGAIAEPDRAVHEALEQRRVVLHDQDRGGWIEAREAPEQGLGGGVIAARSGGLKLGQCPITQDM